MKTVRALVLLSGGLDSILAAKILLEQKIKVTGLIFKSYFFDEQKGVQAAKQLNITYLVVDFSNEHLAMVKKPKYGYGKAINPCLDCHLLMLKTARLFLARSKQSHSRSNRETIRVDSRLRGNDYHFVATGEVLGERPFSQNKKALAILAEESGLKDRLLRPLSAKLLAETLPEKKGWANRENLFAIQDRGRHQQITLAKEWKLSFPQPAGGCLLCEKVFGEKLKMMFKNCPNCDGDDVQLLKFGRHFWQGKNLIVLGRNKEENERLEKLAQKSDAIITPKNFPGPTALIRGKTINKAAAQKTKKMILKFSPKIKKENLSFPDFAELQI